MKRSAWRYLWTSRDIRNKLLYTIGILVLYRFAAHVPVPGVDRAAIASIMAGGGGSTTFVNLLDLLSGGTVSNFSVLAMGVYPYITAQIILQLLIPIVPALQARKWKTIHVKGKSGWRSGPIFWRSQCLRCRQSVRSRSFQAWLRSPLSPILAFQGRTCCPPLQLSSA